MRRLIQLGLATAALAGAGCGGDSSSGKGSAADAGPAVAADEGRSKGRSELASNTRKPPAAGKTIGTAASQYGDVLFSKSNRAIYYFDKEPGRTPKCYGDCAVAWPPVLTGGKPRSGPGVKPSLLGTTKRKDGRKQVTYGGHPLYFYVNDPVGEVECHDVEEFGGLWLAVQPDGAPVPVS